MPHVSACIPAVENNIYFFSLVSADRRAVSYLLNSLMVELSEFNISGIMYRMEYK